jgi:hypothetical protein
VEEVCSSWFTLLLNNVNRFRHLVELVGADVRTMGEAKVYLANSVSDEEINLALILTSDIKRPGQGAPVCISPAIPSP